MEDDCARRDVFFASAFRFVRAQFSVSHLLSLPSHQVRHVFRLLKTALEANRGVEWVLLENVSSSLGRERERMRAAAGMRDRALSQPPLSRFLSPF
jgi:hypothetical protein